MSEFKAALKPYNLDAALTLDRGDDCLVLDVAHNETGQLVSSLQRVVEQVNEFFHNTDAPTFAVTKLYVVGKWNLPPEEMHDEAASGVENIKVSISRIAITRRAKPRSLVVTDKSARSVWTAS
jgi:hypothetical protein